MSAGVSRINQYRTMGMDLMAHTSRHLGRRRLSYRCVQSRFYLKYLQDAEAVGLIRIQMNPAYRPREAFPWFLQLLVPNVNK